MARWRRSTAPGTPEYLLDDGLGSRRGVTNLAGTLTGAADYDTFGAVRASTGAGSAFGYTGEQFDAETGYTYLRARYLNPALGRFTSADSVQPNAPGTQGYNLYAYVANNPTTWVDPSGHLPTEVIEVIEEIVENPEAPAVTVAGWRVFGAWAAGVVAANATLILAGACVCVAAAVLVCALVPACQEPLFDFFKRLLPVPDTGPEKSPNGPGGGTGTDTKTCQQVGNCPNPCQTLNSGIPPLLTLGDGLLHGYIHIEAKHAPGNGTSSKSSEFAESAWGSLEDMELLALEAHTANPGRWALTRDSEGIENCRLNADMGRLMGYPFGGRLRLTQLCGLTIFANPGSREIQSMIPDRPRCKVGNDSQTIH